MIQGLARFVDSSRCDGATALESQPVLTSEVCGSGCASEIGQTTTVFSALIAVVAVFGLGLAQLGEAMVSRAKATADADAVALALVVDPQAGISLADHLDASVDGGLLAGQTRTSSSASVERGQAQALALASLSDDLPEVAPAVRAIIARAEQLTLTNYDVLKFDRIGFYLAQEQATSFAMLAADLGMCVRDSAQLVLFELC